MNLADVRVAKVRTAIACGRRREQRQEGSGARKSDRILGRNKALKGESQERPRLKMVGRREGE
jgi:hypothetical protein